MSADLISSPHEVGEDQGGGLYAIGNERTPSRGVGLAPGSAFGPGGEGHLCHCFASSPDRLSQAMDRLEPALG
jgi:hypothetical protein